MLSLKRRPLPQPIVKQNCGRERVRPFQLHLPLIFVQKQGRSTGRMGHFSGCHKRERRLLQPAKNRKVSPEARRPRAGSLEVYSQKSRLGVVVLLWAAPAARPRLGSTRLRPAFFAWYRAESAACRSFSRSAAASPVATPRLRLTCTFDPPAMMEHPATCTRTRSASSQVSAKPQFGATIRNSSPP